MKNHRIRFHIISNPRSGNKLNIYFLLWTLIIIGSIYLLIRFATLSFSEEMGQADLSLKEIVIYYVSNKAVESGSSLISYTMDDGEEEASFPLNLITEEFAIRDFIEEKSLLRVKAQEYAPDKNYVRIDNGVSEETMDSNASSFQSGTEDSVASTDTKDSETSLDKAAKGGTTVGFKNKVDAGLSMLTEGLSKEYILTNGSIYDTRAYQYFSTDTNNNSDSMQLEMDYLEGNVEFRETEDDNPKDTEAIEASNPGNLIEYTMEQMKDINFLIRNFYIVDPSTKVTEDLFNAEELLTKDMTLKQENDAPQILIYHTHSQETYLDSRENEEADTVVGVGSYLTQILEDRYGYQVIHDTTTYDIVNGQLDRNKAYNVAKDGIEKILDENPTIEVVIDLHRDGVDKRSTVVDGEETAQVMLFNGLSRDQNGPITYLDNPYLQDNLAFSLQLQLKAVEMYPGLFYKNYLECYRYNMHVRPKCLLMELGTYKNTLQSAKNAMEPFAEILNAVLKGK